MIGDTLETEVAAPEKARDSSIAFRNVQCIRTIRDVFRNSLGTRPARTFYIRSHRL
jgi:hypothetical protein